MRAPWKCWEHLIIKPSNFFTRWEIDLKFPLKIITRPGLGVSQGVSDFPDISLLVFGWTLVFATPEIQSFSFGLTSWYWYWYWSQTWPLSRLLVLVSNHFQYQDFSWYWSWQKYQIKASLGIGVKQISISRLVLK